MAEQSFGGPWTLIKLEVLKKYLRFYAMALKNQPFNRIYIDAFAGSGQCTIKHKGTKKKIDGSAKIALDTEPPFSRYIFIENDESNCQELFMLCDNYPDKNAEPYFQDANIKIIDICRNTNWKRNRALMFIDPFGMEVEWETLEEVSKTKAIDLWYLFPYSGMYRQAAKNMDAVDPSKAKVLDRMFGYTGWREDFYKPAPQADMFDEPSMLRSVTHDQMLESFRERLNKIFAHVPSPKILYSNGAPYFALFFAISNPKAVNLSMRAAEYLLKDD